MSPRSPRTDAFFRARDALVRTKTLVPEGANPNPRAGVIVASFMLQTVAELEYVAAHPEHVLSWPSTGGRQHAGAGGWLVWFSDSGRVVASDGGAPVETSDVHSLEAAVCVARCMAAMFREAEEG
jgi:hypothetical protein